MSHHYHHRRRRDDSRASYQLSSMIVDVLRIPPFPIPILASSLTAGSFPSKHSLLALTSSASPAVFASLFIAISMALILFGTIALMIGFLLVPLLITVLLLFYFFNVVSILSNFARSLLCPYPKHVSAVWEFPCCC
ncbi:uncharacterized protein LOC111006451 [Momordica charantia]|uniref:Uncharacterized protein LOC111006451 n=1 Tax=Momordica charantia TaxID=3673 RepID=A0A6J1BX03_MOMCH|nr:uncharacterized protein LOC111006451 [Momordica charantia]